MKIGSWTRLGVAAFALMSSQAVAAPQPAHHHAKRDCDDDDDGCPAAARPPQPRRARSSAAPQPAHPQPKPDCDDDDDDCPVAARPPQPRETPAATPAPAPRGADAALPSGLTPPAIVAPIANPPAVAVKPAKDDDDDDEGDGDDRARTGAITVTARRLDSARASVNPSLGASSYALSNDAIEKRPGGEAASLASVLVQMPGVTQAGAGEIRVRGQSALQYRINNVIVPDGFSDLADTLRARFADRVELVTGALPAQYGLQTGGVINVTTKSGAYGKGGEAELYGGTQGRFEPAFDAMGAIGRTNYYLSGSYQRGDAATGGADASANPLHDHGEQLDGFAYFDRILDAQSRLSLILGAFDDRLDLPHARGLNAASYRDDAPFERPLTVAGISSYPSEAWGGHQRLGSDYGLLSYQHGSGALTMQLSGFLRRSSLALRADPIGDLLFTGLASSVTSRSLAGGVQAEALYAAAPRHQIRAGVTADWSRDRSRSAYAVLPLDGAGRPVSDTPLVVPAIERDRRREQGLFVEDEWRPADRLSVNAGLRFDHVAGPGGGHALGPRINSVWRPADETSLHIGYARYFVPAPEAVGIASARALTGTTGSWPTTTETAPKPERDDYLDAGVEQRLNRLTIGLDAYWRRARDLLDAVRIGATVLARPFNYRIGRAWGVETRAIYAAGPVSAWANLTVASLRGRAIVTGQAPFTAAQLAWSAAHSIRANSDQRLSGSLGLTWRHGRLQLSGDGVFGSGLPRRSGDLTPNGASVPAYAQANVAAVYRLDGLGRRPLSARLDLLNIFDNRSALQDGTSLADGTAQWRAPRSLFVGLEQAF
ncbi:TonB-dependent receptor domain-containing protein [Sphingomonas morindae]|uniref:TonB-dependent receptor n=1 Tax=Sphingomonas morindae TaxID=1541170 RepID=A0ABY4X7H3_9SPHN|nr:TonB-dependent receptor [Sphingomonas morindae]USI72814.1 TonB-dependent receptor [Sphingomonas morindae]